MSVDVQLRDGIALITFDDGNKNVVNHAVLDGLEDAWREAQQASAIVLSGRPGSFCAGYDIRVMTGGDRNAAGELGQRGGRFARGLFACEVPLVGASAGHAFTIGAVWLACCDVRIGERGDFKYAMTEVALGVPLGGWPLAALDGRITPAHRIPALLHSRVYDPEGALEAGFIDVLVDPGTAIDEALETAARLAALPGPAYAATKRALRADALARMDASLG